jgi:hypothetical protein
MEVRLAERFFFDLTNGQSTIPDEGGVLATDVDEAIAQAEAVLGDMRADDELSDDDGAWAMIIRDAAGRLLMTLPIVPRP